MRDGLRITRDLIRVMTSADPHALDRVVGLLEESGNDPAEALLARIRRPRDRVGMAWRRRGKEITQDPADVERSIQVFEQADEHSPHAEAEFALALWFRYMSSAGSAEDRGERKTSPHRNSARRLGPE